MKLCISCGFEFSAPNWRCPNCHWQPDTKNCIPSFVSDSPDNGIGMHVSSFSLLADLEAKNFWFRARNKLLIWVLKRYGSDVSKFMEVGCGTGFVLRGIARDFPLIQLSGSEIFSEGLVFAAERLEGRAKFLQMDARQIPYSVEFDAIGAFDVIEHIQEDETVLKQMCQALKPRGLLMVTVPQHPSLWSSVDEYSCHVRRYTANELHEKVRNAGFKIVRSTSFVSTLLPVMYLSRILRRNKSIGDHDADSELRINPVLNHILEYCLNFEVLLIRLGLSLPIGGSRLVVARKV